MTVASQPFRASSADLVDNLLSSSLLDSGLTILYKLTTLEYFPPTQIIQQLADQLPNSEIESYFEYLLEMHSKRAFRNIVFNCSEYTLRFATKHTLRDQLDQYFQSKSLEYFDYSSSAFDVEYMLRDYSEEQQSMFLGDLSDVSFRAQLVKVMDRNCDPVYKREEWGVGKKVEGTSDLVELYNTLLR